MPPGAGQYRFVRVVRVLIFCRNPELCWFFVAAKRQVMPTRSLCTDPEPAVAAWARGTDRPLVRGRCEPDREAGPEPRHEPAPLLQADRWPLYVRKREPAHNGLVLLEHGNGARMLPVLL